jgi:hypothetical protein
VERGLTVPAGGGRSVASLSGQSIIKRIEGSLRVVENPLASIMRTVAAVFSEGERNRAGEVLASMRTLPGFDEIIREVGPGETPLHSISYLDNGIKRTFAVPEEFEQAAKQLSAVKLNLVARIMALPIRLTKAGITGINPAFALRNLPKDQLAAFTNAKWGWATSILNPPVFLRALYEAVGHGKTYDLMTEHGAMFTGFDPLRTPTVKSLAAIRAERSIPARLGYAATHIIFGGLRAMEDIIGRTEQQTRMQVFEGTVRRELAINHRTLEDAIMIGLKEARTVTANFPRHGELSRAMTLFQIFFNPRIQGSRADIRGLIRNPGSASWKIPVGVFKMIASLLLPVALMTLWNMQDKKRRKAYLDISQTERENNFIWVPMNPQKDRNNKWIVAKLPMPQGYNSLTWPVRRLIEQHFVNDPVRAAEVASGVLNFLSPFEMTKSGLTTAAVPQPVKPFVENLFNQDSFTGAPIVPERLLKYSPPEQYDEIRTSGTMRALSRLLAEGSGGALAYSPMALEHLWRGETGGVGADVLGSVDLAVKKLAEKIAPNQPLVWGVPDRNPITSMVGSFARATGGQQLRNFYDNSKTASADYNDWMKAVTNGEVAKAGQILQDHGGDFAMAKTLSAFSTQLTGLYGVIRMVQHQQLTQTPAQKVASDKQIADMQATILQLAQQANAVYSQVAKPPAPPLK